MIDKEKIEMLQEDLRLQKSIAEIRNSEGGKTIVKGMIKDVISAIENIADNHNTLTQQEFIALGAKVRVNIDLIKVITSSQGNMEYYQDLLEKELNEAE